MAALAELPLKAGHIQIPRSFKLKKLKALKLIEIRNFADVSFYAYAACSYMRLVDTDDNIFCAFVIAKSRLVPIKAVSIPCLELPQQLWPCD